MPLAVMVDRLEKRNEDLRRAVMEMEQLTDTKTSWSKVLNTVSECMNSASGERNSNVWVQRVMVDKRNRMQITGRSVRTEDYILFKNNMANSKRFQNVEVIDSRKEPDGLSFSFVLTCDVLPDYKFIEALKRVQRMIEPAPARDHRVRRIFQQIRVPIRERVTPKAAVLRRDEARELDRRNVLQRER